MTPDLSKLKPGDTVHFRCGGSAVVEKTPRYYAEGCSWVNLGGVEHIYVDNGVWFKGLGENPFDIIRIESAFRLGLENVGEEFILSGNYAEYIGFCQTESRHVFWLKGCCRLAFLSGEILPTDRVAKANTISR